MMPRSNWRARREAYLRERGRITDLIREGYVAGELRRWQVYNGSRRGPANPTGRLTLIAPAGKRPAISPLTHQS
jgi:hypothetical protein